MMDTTGDTWSTLYISTYSPPGGHQFPNISIFSLPSPPPHTMLDTYMSTAVESNSSAINTTIIPTSITDYACYHVNEEDPDLQLSIRIVLYCSLLFFLTGMVGNSLSVAVFSSKEMICVSSNIYLLVLAISDTLYLLSVFFTKTLTVARCMYFVNVPMDIYNRSTAMCKILQFFLDLFADYSACLIMAFTVERFIAVYMPLKYKDLCTLVRAKLTCFIIFAIVSVFIAPYHFLYIGRPFDYDVCTMLPETDAIFSNLYIVEAVIFRVIPVIVIAVLNVQIIIRVTMVTMLKRKQKFGQSQINKKKKDDRGMQLTIMLILVSTSYILVYIPVLVHFVMWKLQRAKMLVVSDKTMTLMQNYTHVLYIGGFSINFFLYTLSGRIFREQLYKLCGKCGIRQHPRKPRIDATEMTSLM